MTCIICCNDYTPQLRKPIKCTNCENECCIICFKRHIIDERNLTCMFPKCGKNFSFIELSRITGNIKFSNEIMDKLALIALEEEKNFLPQRQKYAKKKIEEQKYELRKIERDKIRLGLNNQRHKIYTDHNINMAKDTRVLKFTAEINNLLNQVQKLRAEKDFVIRDLTNERNIATAVFDAEINKIYKEDDDDRASLGMISKEEKQYKFIKQCVYKDCKGFLEDNPLEDGWRCTLCDKLTCRRCHEPLIKQENDNGRVVNHKCNEDIVATLKEIKKDTKPCPNCGTGIFKISGCNHMFCVSCQTGFDWASGKIIKNGLHNPEATRWMRENGRAINNNNTNNNINECIDPITNNRAYYNWMYSYGYKYLMNNKHVYDTIIELTDKALHINEVVLARFNDNYFTKTQDLAVEYLITDGYNEERWTRDIRKFKKQQMFNNEFRNIITLLIEVIRTVLNNVREIIKNKGKVEDIKEQLELIPKIVEECNVKFEDVKKCFNSKRKNKFVISRNRKNFLYELSYS
jgi:hypothetical protein